MKHKIWYDEEHGVVREQFFGDICKDELDEFFNVARRFRNGSTKLKLLSDYTRASRKVYDCAETRLKMTNELVRLNNCHEKLAILVNDAYIRLLAGATALGTKDRGRNVEMKMFQNEGDALAWLKED